MLRFFLKFSLKKFKETAPQIHGVREKCYHESRNPPTEAAADSESMSPVTAAGARASGAGASSQKDRCLAAAGWLWL